MSKARKLSMIVVKNIINSALNLDEEFFKITQCNFPKEMWDILVTHERTNDVKCRRKHALI